MLIGVPQIPNLNELIDLFKCLKLGDETKANEHIVSHPSLCNARVDLLDNVTPLICSVQYEQTEPSLALFNALTESTEDLNGQNRLGFGTIHFLAGYNRANLLKALIENQQHKPLNLNLQNTAGDTPAYIAAFKNACESLYLLLNQKADPNVANTQGQTPLHMACLNGNTVCVSLLLAAGATVNQEDHHKRTPIHYLAQSKAKGSDKNQILDLLLEYGANIHEKSEHNKTAYEMAVRFESGQDLIDSIARNRVPSLLFLCTKTIIKELNPTASELKEAVPEIMAEHIMNNKNCHSKPL